MSTFYFLFSILCLVNAGCRSKEAGSELRVEAIVQKLKVLIHHGNPEAQVLVLVMRFVALASIFAFIALGSSACTGKGGDCTSLLFWCCNDQKCRSHAYVPPGYSGGTATTIYKVRDIRIRFLRHRALTYYRRVIDKPPRVGDAGS